MVKAKLLHRVYHYALAVRGFDGLMDLIFGAIIYFSSSQKLISLLLKLLSEELIEDPNDFLANWLLHLAQSVSAEIKLFIVLYLVVNGIFKIFLILGLWFKKNWVYPPALFLLAVFIFYQIYRLAYHFSWIILVLVIFDTFIFYMAFKDYRQLIKDREVNLL